MELKEEYRKDRNMVSNFINNNLDIIEHDFDDLKDKRRENKIERDLLHVMSRERLEEAGCLDFLVDLEKKHQSTGCHTTLYYLLWHFIEVNKPQYFLECGTGISTHLIARAMREFCYDKYNGNIKLVSMESSEKWYEEALKHPVEHDFVDIVLSEIETFNLFQFNCSCYKDVPQMVYDAVFVDGPPQEDTATMDILKVAQWSRNPIAAIIDNRGQTVLALFLMFGKKFFQRYGNVYMFGPIHRNTLWKERDGTFSWKVSAMAQERMCEILYRIIDSGVTYE